MTSMTSRERLLTALAHRRPDRVPRDMSWGLTPAALETFREQTGRDDPDDYFGIDIRFVGQEHPEADGSEDAERRRSTFGRYYRNLPPEATLSEWGTANVPGSFYHFTRMIMPMREFSSVHDIDAYPFPAFDEPQRLALARERIQSFHQRGLAVGGAMAQTIFEIAWAMRGMEELFSDFAFHPEMASALLDRITEIRRQQARFFAENDVDVLVLGDDISMQTGMLMGPRTWRDWFKGRLASVIQAARDIKPDIQVFYHSDGNPERVIPELVEIGVTILNPIQPECIDPVMVKREYGDQLTLWGTTGIQTTLPFGTPDEVRRVVRERIETLGQDGGLVLGPTHTIEPEAPWENIVAMYEAIDESGVYH